MNDTRGTHRGRRISARIAGVLCLLLALGLVPMAAFAAPKTVSDVEATYLNSAKIDLMTTSGSIDHTYMQLDGGAQTEGTSMTTSVYGVHSLKFWSVDTSGVVEASPCVAPFFVEDDVLPVLGTDCKASYVGTASIEITATDNFNGSGVDELLYRVDGGQWVTSMAPAQLKAAKALIAQIATVKVSVQSAKMGPDLPVGATAPANHFEQGTGLPGCLTCHDYIMPIPDPGTTSTVDPTGTPAPMGGVNCNLVVTGVGSHKVEYYAQDVARNVTAHVTKSFAITAAAAAPRTPTSLSLKVNDTTLRVGQYATMSSILKPAVPAGAHVRYQIRLPGKSSYTILSSTRDVSAAGASSLRYKFAKRGTYYVMARYLGSATFDHCDSHYVRVVVK